VAQGVPSRCAAPAAGHRVPGIHGKVHEHLVHLPTVGPYPVQLRIERGFDFDVHSEQHFQHSPGIEDQAIQIHDTGA